MDRGHSDSLKSFIEVRRSAGVRTKSINNALGVVRRILNLAARSWRDEHGLTWLDIPPLIEMLPVIDGRKPYPLDWDEQRRLIQKLPKHLARMVLFKVNTGTREQEVCRLRWEWEIAVPELETSVFLIPPRDQHGRLVKNGEDRLLVLNHVARSVIEEIRAKGAEERANKCPSPCPLLPEAGGEDFDADRMGYVLTYRGRRIGKMNNTAWKRAWQEAKLPVDDQWLRGVHNLKHAFGRRLRAAGVPLETRRVLLRHKTRDITSHYSAPEIQELIDAANRVYAPGDVHKTPTLTLLKRKTVNVGGR